MRGWGGGAGTNSAPPAQFEEGRDGLRGCSLLLGWSMRSAPQLGSQQEPPVSAAHSQQPGRAPVIVQVNESQTMGDTASFWG